MFGFVGRQRLGVGLLFGDLRRRLVGFGARFVNGVGRGKVFQDYQ